MISDVLVDAAMQISEYLDSPLYMRVYRNTRPELQALVELMYHVCKLVDTPEERLCLEEKTSQSSRRDYAHKFEPWVGNALRCQVCGDPEDLHEK